MTTETQESIIEHIRSLKEENAAEYGYSLEAIIASARERQNSSGRRIIRLTKKGESGRRGVLTPAPHTTGHTDLPSAMLKWLRRVGRRPDGRRVVARRFQDATCYPDFFFGPSG